MKVEITVTGPYSDFTSDPPGRAVVRRAGEIVEYPDWYGRGLCDAGLATPVGDVPPPTPQPEQRDVTARDYTGRRRRK